MIFEPTAVDGARIVKIEPHVDDRGFFARSWCLEEFASHGIPASMVQTSISYNSQAGTLRGMHFAWPPSRENKLVRCTRGRIYDVILDLRPGSPSYRAWLAVELDASVHNAIFVPAGVAHGFQTMVHDAEVNYMMTEAYRPEFAGGVRYDDAAFGLKWPMPVSRVADRDRSYADFDDAAHQRRFLGGWT